MLEDRIKTLTKREREVWMYIARGLSHKEIALALGIQKATAEKHAATLRIKLGISGAANLTRAHIQHIEPLSEVRGMEVTYG